MMGGKPTAQKGLPDGKTPCMRALALAAASRHSLSRTPIVAAHAPLLRPARPLLEALAASRIVGGPAEAERQAALRAIPRGQPAQQVPESPGVS